MAARKSTSTTTTKTLQSLVSSLKKNPNDPRPGDVFTTLEAKKELGFGLAKTKQILDDWVGQGLVIRTKFQTVDSWGDPCKKAGYQLVKK